MKKVSFITVMIVTFCIEVLLCLFIVSKINYTSQDSVAVNAVVHSIEENFSDSSKYDNSLSYVVIDNEGKVVYKNKKEISDSIVKAIKHRDTILDITVNHEIVGKIIFYNDTFAQVTASKQKIIVAILSILGTQFVCIFFYFFYLKKSIIEPFKKLNDFALRVAEGNLDLPLKMDKKHIFGNFTEAFDLMRTELKKSKMAEQKANAEKKEVIAQLSHDIKTPIASIKSTSELGVELSREKRSKELFYQINLKSDQLTILTDNLFHSSIEETTNIEVHPSVYSSEILYELLKQADFLEKTSDFTIPACQVYLDKLRLQQVFDNVLMNSYKYADTIITVESYVQDEYLVVNITDFGKGVPDMELPLLKEKYKRGSNAKNKEGAGLGLYLTNFFLEKMEGKLSLANTSSGFSVCIYLRTI